MSDNLILIGMPGSGKSTIGVQLAKALGLEFVDTDLLIQQQQGQLLQTILDEQGYLALREIEAKVLLGLHTERALISTGGSAVYSEPSMQHLKQLGPVVYLQVSLDTVLARIDNEGNRGIARPSHHSLADVYAERVPLYERYADITINNDTPFSLERFLETLAAYKKSLG